ncbi:MAG: hypothetical protein IT383_28440 [Deltaproteobacteria bacterium]|nr:hypothetical protein [Deltaproteobacteria bacterium]
MPVVGTNPYTPPTPSTTATTPTGAASSSTAGSTGAGSTASPIPSGAGRVALPLQPIQGMGSVSFDASNTVPQAGTTNTGATSAGTATQTGAYTRGRIDVESAPCDANSFLLTVKTRHSNDYNRTRQLNDDKMTLVLQCRVQDGASEGIINLAVLKNQEPCNNKSAFEGEHTFRIAYDDVNKLLQSYNPALKLAPGANLAVAASWSNGHQWGGYNRAGVFEVPAPPATTSILGARVNATQRPSGTGGANLPLDIEHKMPPSVRTSAPAGLFGSEVKVSSRLETELKGELGAAEELEFAIARLYQIANDPSVAQGALGAGWSIAPVTHWWQTDPSTRRPKPSARMTRYTDPQHLLRVGLAKTQTEADQLARLLQGCTMGDPLPLEDKYSGTSDELRASIIQRIRSNQIAEGVFNLKPGPGVLLGDVQPGARGRPSALIRKRIEYGYTLASKNVDRAALEGWLRTDRSAYNPAGEALRQLMPNGATGQHVAFTMDQERHRFTLKHQGGLEIDVSIDFVVVKHPVTGQEARKYMVEMEIDHQYINAPGRSSPSTPRPTSLRSFRTEGDQRTWAQGLSGSAQLNGSPRFHELPDLQDPALWQTPEQKETEAAIDRLFPLLFPSGAKPSQQKGVAMATTLRLI